MTRLQRAAIVGALGLMSAAPLLAAPQKVTGVLVDEMCYTKDHKNTGLAHEGMGATCAQDCAKKGQQVALVTSKGEVYDVMPMGNLAGENNAKLVPHMSHTVTLTGEVMTMNGKQMIHATDLAMVGK